MSLSSHHLRQMNFHQIRYIKQLNDLEAIIFFEYNYFIELWKPYLEILQIKI